jgi:tRNA pseudouridine(38-40) synthase
MSGVGATEPVESTCTLCSDVFSSKRKLFDHLEKVHDLVSDRAKPCKVAVQVGWLSHESNDMETFLKDSRLNSDISSLALDADGYALTEDEVRGNGTTKARIETLLFHAIKDSCDAGLPPSAEERMKAEARLRSDVPDGPQLRSRSDLLRGHTRGSQESESTLSLGLERTCHALADTICMILQRPPGNEQSWLTKVNSRLPSDIRVLSCRVLPGKGSDLNAFASCSQRRFEYMMPLSAFLPENEEEYAACAHHLVDGRTIRSRKEREWQQYGPPSALDEEFPDDTEEGCRRVQFFRILKNIMKNFGGKFQQFYNYSSGGACPEDPCTQRTIDRIYHKSMSRDPSGEAWAVFSISGDNFLRGQIRRLFGVAIAVARGWLPEEFIDYSLRSSTVYRDELQLREKAKRIAEREEKMRLKRQKDEEDAAARALKGDATDLPEKPLTKDKKKKKEKPQDITESRAHRTSLKLLCEPLCYVPSAPAPGLYLAECKYGNYEAKYEKHGAFVLDPRRTRDDPPSATDQACIDSMNEWENILQNHIMSYPGMKQACHNWAKNTKEQCHRIWTRVQYDMSRISRSELELKQNALKLYPSNMTSNDRAPEVYRKVLYLLQEADRSGAWPRSSFARQALLEDSSQSTDISPSVGGTFTLGAFPDGQQQPKGNPIFPELLKAIFELERVIMPHREPSSTVAINKHAQFKIHRDSGAGSGQSTSAIVALGDFTGGELGLDWLGLESVDSNGNHISNDQKSVLDIRYNPIEFCGWTSRHFTLPFAGERYSLVWFTPLGCSKKDMFWWNTAAASDTKDDSNVAKRARVENK